MISISIITVSDRAAAGIYADKAGPAVVDWLETNAELFDRFGGFEPLAEIVADDYETLTGLLDRSLEARLIITTGGTGITPRDITPEVITQIADRILPGFGEAMRAASLAEGVDTAPLSRCLGATRNKTVIVGLPGSPRAINTCLNSLRYAIPHAIAMLNGDDH